MKKRGELKIRTLIIILIGLIAALFFLLTIVFNFFPSDSEKIQNCLDECAAMKTELSMINPGTGEHAAQEELLMNKSKDCLAINIESTERVSEEEILEACGITEENLNCVPSGETLYLNETETCPDGIEKCCTKKAFA